MFRLLFCVLMLVLDLNFACAREGQFSPIEHLAGSERLARSLSCLERVENRSSCAHPKLLFVLSGPSGVGKTTIMEKILERDTRLGRVVSFTTRKPRPGERQGIDYHFVTREEFLKMLTVGHLLEHQKVYNQYYALSKSSIENNHRDVLMLNLNSGGFESLKSVLSHKMIGISIEPGSLSVLKQRLARRGGENEDALAERLRSAQKEIESCKRYDYQVINDDLERAIKDIEDIIAAERSSFYSSMLHPDPLAAKKD